MRKLSYEGPVRCYGMSPATVKQELMEAICRQACNDYVKNMRKMSKGSDTAIYELEMIEDFFEMLFGEEMAREIIRFIRKDENAGFGLRYGPKNGRGPKQ